MEEISRELPSSIFLGPGCCMGEVQYKMYRFLVCGRSFIFFQEQWRFCVHCAEWQISSTAWLRESRVGCFSTSIIFRRVKQYSLNRTSPREYLEILVGESTWRPHRKSSNMYSMYNNSARVTSGAIILVSGYRPGSVRSWFLVPLSEDDMLPL